MSHNPQFDRRSSYQGERGGGDYYRDPRDQSQPLQEQNQQPLERQQEHYPPTHHQQQQNQDRHSHHHHRQSQQEYQQRAHSNSNTNNNNNNPIGVTAAAAASFSSVSSSAQNHHEQHQHQHHMQNQQQQRHQQQQQPPPAPHQNHQHHHSQQRRDRELGSGAGAGGVTPEQHQELEEKCARLTSRLDRVMQTCLRLEDRSQDQEQKILQLQQSISQQDTMLRSSFETEQRQEGQIQDLWQYTQDLEKKLRRFIESQPQQQQQQQQSKQDGINIVVPDPPSESKPRHHQQNQNSNNGNGYNRSSLDSLVASLESGGIHRGFELLADIANQLISEQEQEQQEGSNKQRLVFVESHFGDTRREIKILYQLKGVGGLHGVNLRELAQKLRSLSRELQGVTFSFLPWSPKVSKILKQDGVCLITNDHLHSRYSVDVVNDFSVIRAHIPDDDGEKRVVLYFVKRDRKLMLPFEEIKGTLSPLLNIPKLVFVESHGQAR